MNSTNRAELAAFLRARRARLSPRQAGLPGTGSPGRRRTPGLRRQEVAQLAGMSVDYYIRLEQGRGPHPSRQVLSALARALMLTVEVRGPMLKYVSHPQVGPLEFECQVLHITDTGQRLIAYCAAPGSATEAAFRRLASGAPQPA